MCNTDEHEHPSWLKVAEAHVDANSVRDLFVLIADITGEMDRGVLNERTRDSVIAVALGGAALTMKLEGLLESVERELSGLKDGQEPAHSIQEIKNHAAHA